MDSLMEKKLQVTREASDRGRQVLLVTQIACIIIFMAAWLESPVGWTDSRLRTAQAAVYLFDCSDDFKSMRPHSDTSDYERCNYYPPIKVECSSPTGKPFCQDEIEQARAFIAGQRLTPEQARKSLEIVRTEVFTHIKHVAVPFLGITLDINDLGLFGGISFALLLTWLLFSLRSEEQNVCVIFATANNDEFLELYQCLAMAQVLTMVPSGREKNQHIATKIWVFLERLLFLTPCLVLGFVCVLDQTTRYSGGTILSKSLTNFQLSAELFFFGVMIALTWRCFHKTEDIEQHWQDAYKRVCLIEKERQQSLALL